LVHAAGTIGAPLPAATMQALISLLAASSLRVGEALALDGDALDEQIAMVSVTGKNDQTRLVPLHATTVAMLAGYAARRDRLCPAPVSPGFFLTATGRRVQQGGAQQIFARLLTAADIHTAPGRRRSYTSMHIRSCSSAPLKQSGTAPHGMTSTPGKNGLLAVTR
jgi:site-specific recombinase XerD